MVRHSQSSQGLVSKQLKTKLTKKQILIKSGTPSRSNESSSNLDRSSSETNTQHNYARKSIENGNKRSSAGKNTSETEFVRQNYARKSIENGNKRSSAGKNTSETEYVRQNYARKSIENGNKRSSAGTSTNEIGVRQNDAEKSIANENKRRARKSILGNKKESRKLTPKENCKRHHASRISHRRKPGVLALQQIRYYQNRAGLLIPKFSFQRVVREIVPKYSSTNYRIQSDALLALQEAAEVYLVRKFEDGQLCAIHANRVTLMNSDFALLKSLQD